MKWQRWHVVAAAGALAAIGFFSFGKCGGAASSQEGKGALEPPAHPPDDLIADVYVSSPNSSWTKLQRGVGGAVGILPMTLPGVIVALSDLDGSLSGELDGTSPMFAVIAGQPSQPSFALAIRLVDPRHTRTALDEGDAGRFTTKDVSGMTLLVPNRAAGGAKDRLEVALSPNGYLVVTRQTADLAKLGAYVTRTLPERFAGTPSYAASSAVVEVPRSALAKVLAPSLESAWKDGKSFLLTQDERMRAERGRAPDFGDPVAVVAALDGVLGRRIAVTSDLQKVRMTIDVTDDAAVLDATLTPVAGANGPARAWVDGMKVGDLAPVLALPATSALAASTRDSETERDAQAAELEKAITTSLRLKDSAKIHDVIDAAKRARDESFAFALAVDEPTGLLVRAPVRDAAAADKAIREAFDLTKAEPFKELLHARDVSTKSEELPGIGSVALATVTREPTRAEGPRRSPRGTDAGAPSSSNTNPKPGTFGAAWLTDHGLFSLGAGAEPTVTLKIGAKPEKKLGDEPALSRFAASVGSDVTTAVVGQPLRFDPKRANLPTAPVAIAIGRRSGEAFVHVDIADGLIREAARWQMGF